MDSTATGPSEITLNSPVVSYVYAKLTDETEFKRNLAAKIFSTSSFTSIETGKRLDPKTVAKDAIHKASVFWDTLPESWKKEEKEEEKEK